MALEAPPRSLLFVPGDRPERFAKAFASAADAVILDLEDSVSGPSKALARDAITKALSAERPGPVLVRINPIDTAAGESDLTALRTLEVDGIMVPKIERAHALEEVRARLENDTPLLPLLMETPQALFEGRGVTDFTGRLVGVTWGGEDLSSALGAANARDPQGAYIAPLALARSIALFAAAAAQTPAFETVYPAIQDDAGLARLARRAAYDGFSGMLAIHPRQAEIINSAFTPAPDALAQAERIVEAFAATGGAHGAVQLDGRMVDVPHLRHAERLLARARLIERALLRHH